MKRPPCAFVRNEQTGLATIQPAVPWFAQGHGFATRKWDGIPYLIEWSDEHSAYLAYRGVTLDPDEPIPIKLKQTSDAGVVPVTGWISVGNAESPLFETITADIQAGRKFAPGTYELCGPGIKDNHEGFDQVGLIKHDLITYLRCPRVLDDLIMFMIQHPSEGLVWKYGEQYCQLTRHDVGLPWPEEVR